MNVLQLRPQIMDAFLDQPAVDFQLFFAGAPHPHAHFEPGKVRPHTFQPW